MMISSISLFHDGRTAARLAVTAALLAATVLATRPMLRAQATATLTTVHDFSASEGGVAAVNLIEGTDGNFYGSIPDVGADYSGVIFEISSSGALTTLYTFPGLPSLNNPSGLVLGNDGNFYGTANDGNSDVVFKYTLGGTVTTVHTFSGSEGYGPTGLVLGGDGNFYGANAYEGTGGYSTVFRISPSGTATVLHNFSYEETGGAKPNGPLVEGTDGNFYGSTLLYKSTNDVGTLYKITPTGTLTTLYNFTDGGSSALLAASNGNVYCLYGGTILQVTPAGVVSTLYPSTGTMAQNIASLVEGSDGNLYGASPYGGDTDTSPDNNGFLFQLTPTGTFIILHTFDGSDGTGAGALVQSRNGSFYGITFRGGADGNGTFYQLSVAGLSTFFTGEILLGDSVYYLQFPNGNPFGFYSFLGDLNCLYHFDLGYEYLFDADDGENGLYLYDFASNDFFYTSPNFPFPYLYDFGLNSTVYYYPDPNNSGRYNTDGVRYFYVFNTGQIITK